MPRYLPLLIWMVISLGLLAGSALLFKHRSDFNARTIAAEGKVTSASTSWVNGKQVHTATIEWKDKDGGAHSYSSTSGYEGDLVEVRYDPKDPRDYGTGGMPMAAIILGVIGLVFLVIGVKSMLPAKAK